ncbi:E3 ubiquitin-protein ligase rad18 [Tulasnella sp. JGI-2019a]|nr:E3 ubiquitin-protein ligase rad18 [Tulasnella sp. JGI-2019a]KAG9016419.1 E3 ubiquitin-protein ligase rad18 [Tulasnella sp. JGI-2019a]
MQEDTTDPSDYPSSQPSLRNLDESLRCPICKDILRAPVLLTGCGHSFCSQCVRESLNVQEECPQCRARANSGHIVRNSALDAAVVSYMKARQSILDVIGLASRPIPPPRGQTPKVSGKRKRRSGETVEHMSDVEEMDVEDWAAASTSKAGSTANAHRLRAMSHRVSSSDSRLSESKGTDTGSASVSDESALGMIECPQCAELVEYIDINEHLDNGCITPSSAPSRKKKKTGDGGEGKRAWQNIFNGAASSTRRSTNSKVATYTARSTSPPERLPREAYDTLKDKQLRERLARFDLSTTGSRAKLQARHERWAVIFNANMDQDEGQRRSLSALKAALVKWEEGREKDEKERVKAVESSAGAGDSGVIGKEYEAKHQSHFKSLVEQARASKAKPSNHQIELPRQVEPTA